MRTIQVNYTTRNNLQDRKPTTLYSKMGDLVVTKELDPDSPTKYVVTHKASGLGVVRTHKLAQAFQALRALLPLTDWSKSREQLEYDMDLLAQVRAAVSPLHLQVSTRKY